MIKSKSRIGVCLKLAVILLTAALAGSALAKPRDKARHDGFVAMPFKGVVEAVETYDIHFPTMWVDTFGTGTAKHFGRFTVTWEATVDLPTGAGVGSARFVFVGGDRLYTTVLGQGDPTGIPDEFRVVELHTITGGTGRFAGASGHFTMVRLAERTGATAGSFDGTVVIAKQKDRGGDERDD